ncbi:hypothetical protein PYCC9005_005871 [Savitreella phatthalungensis]
MLRFLMTVVSISAELPLQPTVTFSTGTVKGLTLGVVDSFRGIHYARSERLKSPQRITADQGVIDGTRAEDVCIALGGGTTPNIVPELLAQTGTTPNAKEDCLTLNIFRPAGATGKSSLPVAFYIHGGAWESGDTQIYTGVPLLTLASVQSQPLVLVTVNYRLAGYGFLGGSALKAAGYTNLGLQDQRIALEWVADNIAYFGGDPSRVTIWGESAGSFSVFDQLLFKRGNHTYNGKALFRAAIMQSGTLLYTNPVDSAKPQRIFDDVARAAGCANANDTVECLRQVPTDVFTAAMNTQPGVYGQQSLALSYCPRADGNVLLEDPIAQLTNGPIAAVPLLVTDCEDEGTLFSLTQKGLNSTSDVVDYFSTNFYPELSMDQVQRLVDLWPDDPYQGSPFRTGPLNNELYPQFKRVAAMLGDLIFTLVRRRTIDLFTARFPKIPVWSALFSNQYGVPLLGTAHGSDSFSAFGAVPGNTQYTLQTFIIAFVATLNPNTSPVPSQIFWPAWQINRTLVQFNLASNNLVQDDFRLHQYEYIRDNQGLLVIN